MFDSAIYRFTTAPPSCDLPTTEHLQYLPLKNSEGQWRLVAIDESDYDEQEKLYKQASVNGSVSQYKFSYMYKWQTKLENKNLTVFWGSFVGVGGSLGTVREPNAKKLENVLWGIFWFIWRICLVITFSNFFRAIFQKFLFLALNVMERV